MRNQFNFLSIYSTAFYRLFQNKSNFTDNNYFLALYKYRTKLSTPNFHLNLSIPEEKFSRIALIPDKSKFFYLCSINILIFLKFKKFFS
jgi:hypothetical protein